jgi:phospholipid/cholesterol/gamma-HCH transport system substrate-binding protein
MSRNSKSREVWVGLAVITAMAALLTLVTLASDGPGFLSPQRTVDVVFRDVQGLRVGSPVRVAGLDSGNVVAADIVEVDGMLWTQVRITLPAKLVRKLRQDVKISIQPSLTGMSHVNVLSAGKSSVALVPGQTIAGVETSFLDPIIEQLGLGPAERNHLSHTVAQVRETIDSIGPRVRQTLSSLQETANNLREMSDSVRPAVESAVNHVDDLAQKLNTNTPRIERILAQVEAATAHVKELLGENRENLRLTVASTRDLVAATNDIIDKNRPKVERMVDGLEGTRARADRVLFQADQMETQLSLMLARNQAEIDRSITNVRDATDWLSKLVQKIFSNPFVLSPFYKPSHEDLRVGAVYDTAQAFMKAAAEVHDAAKTLDAIAARPTSPQQQQDLANLQRKVRVVTDQLNETSTRLAEALKRPGTNGRDRTLR